ncbi:MAG: SOS response-associated peptidase family protein [Chitinophagaceae bacterium]|nr:SOS response-associated peptidase family protein [Chitinophagaceae bacterium]
MCYDISFTVNIPEISDYFPELIIDGQIQMEFGPIDHAQGVGVFAKYPVIYVNRDDQKLHCRLMEWSIIEFFRKEKPELVRRNGMLNIRSERILDDKSSYWYKIRNRRCLIPVTGIFEHRGIIGWKKKVPYWIRPKDQCVFFLPGLYSVAEIADKETGEMISVWTFGLITRAANALMRNIHNDGENRHRMPLFLPLETSKEFVSENLTEERYKEILAYEMPADDLEHRPVFTIRTSKLRPDNLTKTDLFQWENLPELGVNNPL